MQDDWHTTTEGQAECARRESEAAIATLKDALEESRLRHREAAAQWAETKGKLEAQRDRMREAVKLLIGTCEGLADQQAMEDNWWMSNVETAKQALQP